MQEKIETLFRVITALKDQQQCRDLFEDLCTQKEIEKMAERLYAASLLLAGNTYNQVIAQTDISSATLSRVSRCVQYGKGYSQVLKQKEEQLTADKANQALNRRQPWLP